MLSLIEFFTNHSVFLLNIFSSDGADLVGCPLVVAFLSPSPPQEVRGVLTLALPGNNVHHLKCLEVKTTALSAKA